MPSDEDNDVFAKIPPVKQQNYAVALRSRWLGLILLVKISIRGSIPRPAWWFFHWYSGFWENEYL